MITYNDNTSSDDSNVDQRKASSSQIYTINKQQLRILSERRNVRMTTILEVEKNMLGMVSLPEINLNDIKEIN